MLASWKHQAQALKLSIINVNMWQNQLWPTQSSLHVLEEIQAFLAKRVTEEHLLRLDSVFFLTSAEIRSKLRLKGVMMETLSQVMDAQRAAQSSQTMNARFRPTKICLRHRNAQLFHQSHQSLNLSLIRNSRHLPLELSLKSKHLSMSLPQTLLNLSLGRQRQLHLGWLHLWPLSYWPMHYWISEQVRLYGCSMTSSWLGKPWC